MFNRFLLLITTSPFLKHSVALFIGTMAANILNYIFHVTAGRIVSVSVYGEIESLISLLVIISVPAGTLTTLAIKYSAYNKAHNDPYGSEIVFWYLQKKILMYGLPFLLIAFFITPFVRDFLHITSISAIVFLWFIMFTSFFAAVSSGILAGWQKFTHMGLFYFFGALIKIIIGILLLWIGFGLPGALFSFFVSTLGGYIISLFFLRFIFSDTSNDNISSKSRTNFDNINAMKRDLIPAFCLTFGIAVLGYGDMVIAKHHLDPIAAGEYGALMVVAKVIFFLTGVIASVLFAVASEETHKKKNSLHTFFGAFGVVSIVCLGSTGFYFLFPEFILSIFFGKTYVHVAPYLVWFSILVSLYSLVNLVFQYLLSIHKKKAIFLFFIVSLIEIIILILYGNTLRDILQITIFIHIFVLCIGYYFLFHHTLCQKKQ